MKSKALLEITPGFYSPQKKLFQSQNLISEPEQIVSPKPNYRQQDLSWLKSEYFSWLKKVAPVCAYLGCALPYYQL